MTTRSYGIQILGVDAKHEPLVSTLPGLVKQGRYLQPGASREEIVIGSVLARNLKIEPGDELSFLGSGFDDSFAAGVVNGGRYLRIGYSPISTAPWRRSTWVISRIASRCSRRGHSIVIRAPHIDAVEQLQTRISALLGIDEKHRIVRHWDELQPGLRQAIQADMTSAWFMYIVLIVLVAFSVLNTQLMSVLERTREFGTMMALGLKPVAPGATGNAGNRDDDGLGLLLGITLGWFITWYLSVVGFSYPGMAEMAVKFNLPDRMYPAISLISLTLGPESLPSAACWPRSTRHCA